MTRSSSKGYPGVKSKDINDIQLQQQLSVKDKGFQRLEEGRSSQAITVTRDFEAFEYNPENDGAVVIATKMNAKPFDWGEPR